MLRSGDLSPLDAERHRHAPLPEARHFVLTTPEKFDIITSDPIHPWVKGSATLYTRDYFELVKKRLNPGGVITQWVPLYESHLDVVKSEVATFMDVFPGGTVWSNDISGKGYDVVLAGRVNPTPIDIDSIRSSLFRFKRAARRATRAIVARV